jgi:hypothetical protein
MKTLQEYTSQELYNELKRREETIEYLEKNCLDFNGTKIEDVVVKYGNDGYCFLYAPHIKKGNGSLEFLYKDYVLHRKIMPSCFYDEQRGIYSSQVSLEKSLDILKKCGISYHRDDAFFID